MTYVIVNNLIEVSDGAVLETFDQGSAIARRAGLGGVRVCVVDCDVLIAAAPEGGPGKKDSALSAKFKETYRGEYVLQDEQISPNVFQVIGIKAERVKEIYSWIPANRIEEFVPYAVAVRNTFAHGTFGHKRVVFLDDRGHEKLITVFQGMRFGRTRTVLHEKADQLLPEIKRSAMDFEKKAGSQSRDPLRIVTNSADLCTDLQEIEKELPIELISTSSPAVDGLRTGGFSLKFILPEEMIARRRRLEGRKWRQTLVVSMMIFLSGTLFLAYERFLLRAAQDSLRQEEHRKLRFQALLKQLDPLTYRSALKQQRQINYAAAFLRVAQALPPNYFVQSVRFTGEGPRWVMEEYLYAGDDDSYYPLSIHGLRGVHVEDLFINRRPGKFLRLHI